MPRPKRICVPGLPHHLVQRGNNRQATFYDHTDYAVYLAFLEEAAAENGVAVHAYVLMTNHVHLLATPSDTTSLSKAVQSLGRRYVAYINKTHERTGTLWEGRFRSSVVDNDFYCLACYRYIESNPVRASIVPTPAEYRWSSYGSNALGKKDSLITPHSVYLALAQNRPARNVQYRRMFRDSLNSNVVEQLRIGARKGLPVGTESFKASIEREIGQRPGTGAVGRPRQ